MKKLLPIIILLILSASNALSDPCNGDFECDGDVDGTDAVKFKADFFRKDCDPMWIMADSSNPTQSSIEAVLATIGSEERTLLLGPVIWTIDGYLKIPSNVTLMFLRGAVLDIQADAEVEIYGQIDAGFYKIFQGEGALSGKPNNNTIYPEWFGALTSDARKNVNGELPDFLGVADQNTIAIQRAIDWQAGPVELMKGTYYVTDTIYFWGYGMSLRGQGQNETIIYSYQNPSSESEIVRWGHKPSNPGEHMNSEMYLGDMLIRGNQQSPFVGIIVGGAADVRRSINGEMNNIGIADCYIGLKLINSQGVMYRNIQIERCADYGIYCYGDSSSYQNTGSHFQSCRIMHNDVGMYIEQARGFSFSGCVFEENANEGVSLFRTNGAGGGYDIFDITFKDCWFEANLKPRSEMGNTSIWWWTINPLDGHKAHVLISDATLNGSPPGDPDQSGYLYPSNISFSDNRWQTIKRLEDHYMMIKNVSNLRIDNDHMLHGNSPWEQQKILIEGVASGLITGLPEDYFKIWEQALDLHGLALLSSELGQILK